MPKIKNLAQLNIDTFSMEWKFSASTKLRIEKILKLIGSGNRVLDVGCFDGRISKKIQGLKNEVIGIDISPAAIAKTKKLGIKAYVVNLEKESLPKGIGLFEVIVAAEIIEHILDTDNFVQKMAKYLKPKGSLIITTPNLAGFGSRMSLLLGKLPWMIENDVLSGKSGHIRYFTLDELQKLLERNGFKIEIFTSDAFGIGQDTNIPFLAQSLPRLGRSLIVKAIKI